MASLYRPIPLDLIDVPEGRRAPDPDWVAALAESINRHGQRTPIEVVACGNRFRLVIGASRLAACARAKIAEITAAVHPEGSFTDVAQERLAEIAENFIRRNLTVLERALYVADWRAIYEAAQGEVKPGRKKSSQRETISDTDPNARAAAMFSAYFSEAAQRALGLTRPTVYRFLKIAGLDEVTRDRVVTTAIADSQADLYALACVDVEIRARALDLLFAAPPEAATVADAITLANGTRLKTAQEKLFDSTSSNLSRLSPRDRCAIFNAYEAEIRAYAKDRGWI
ncbi:MAG: ParB N-terminal domain-containing protein [Mesorhizobium sp.]|nr:ParB N-terminal domain-containing protein [Mesorhizobium sp.]MBN9243418.1 ParB N-terminal domain-containing protein [Mesorhizobium sp.]